MSFFTHKHSETHLIHVYICRYLTRYRLHVRLSVTKTYTNKVCSKRSREKE